MIRSRGVCEQSSFGACARKGRFRFRRTPEGERYQRRKAPRFTALREGDVEICRRCACGEWPQPYLAVWPYITPTSPWTSWSLSDWRRTELESACAACFVSAQPESNDHDAVRIRSKRVTTFAMSTLETASQAIHQICAL